jgi:carboxylesterase type B
MDSGRTEEPYRLDLGSLGVIEGLTIKDNLTGAPICHYFGGLDYALPPLGDYRWRMPRALPEDHRYGTPEQPGRFTRPTRPCPQLPYMDDLDEWDEHCLRVGIYIPAGEPPAGGWPVVFKIHGGFLQVGESEEGSPVDLFAGTPMRAVWVCPGYRLNLFGFLASHELTMAAPGEPIGNLGFWDQRLALEWTAKNIHLFSGDASNLTAAGYSAGSHSVFKQLQHDLYLPDEKSIIKRAIMWSNGPGMNPKSLEFAQEQFDELLKVVGIPLSLPAEEKVSRLRKISAKTLVDAIEKMERHQFRAVLDGTFNRPDLYRDIDSGDFARRMKERNLVLLTGECRDEHTLYETWFPPTSDSLEAVAERLRVEYPTDGINSLLPLYYPNGELPPSRKNWLDEFGYIYADMQVHMLERGFINKLIEGGAGHLVFRYRMEWRVKNLDDVVPPEMGVTHGSDGAIWFWGNGIELTPEEKTIAWKGVVSGFTKLVKGDIDGLKEEWGTSGPLQARRIKSDGSIDIWDDEMWDRGVKVWDLLRSVGATS